LLKTQFELSPKVSDVKATVGHSDQAYR